MKLGVLFFLFISTASALEFEGKAYDLKTRELLYVEKHKTQVDADGSNKLIETDYVDATGARIAKIRSDLSKNKFIPDVTFEDDRQQYKDEQTWLAQTNEVQIKRTYLKTNKVKQRKFSAKKNMLGGQGFNNFLLANFSQLMENKSIHVNFIVLASQDYFQFDITKKGEPMDGQVRFGLNVSSYFLKMFVSEIQVTYDIATKKLLTFRGLSNLVDLKGDPMKVEIKYEYAN